MSLTAAIQLYDITWRNVQHNEKLRNNLLILFLAISAAFISLSQATSGDGGVSASVFLMGAIAIYALALLFLWIFMRIKEMISRDNALLRNCREVFSQESDLAPFTQTFTDYAKRSTNIVRRGSVTVASGIVLVTIASATLTSGMLVYLDQDGTFVAWMFPLLVFVTFVLWWLMAQAAQWTLVKTG
jgi:hypothetical protein